MDTATDSLDPEADMTPDELAAAVSDELVKITDLAQRYHAARAAEPLMKAALARVARTAVNEMWDAGLRGAAIAKALGVSRQRADQLIDPARLGKVRGERLAARKTRLEGELKKVRSAERHQAKAAS